MNITFLMLGAYLASMNSHLSHIQYDLEDWQSFKSLYAKQYGDTKLEKVRRSIFAYNKNRVDEFNEKISEEMGFSLKLNHLADISSLEMKMINGFRLPENASEVLTNDYQAESFLNTIFNDKSIEVPDQIDWRQVPGRVSSVKNQGNCGSCWAFASTGVLEGQEKVRGSSEENQIVELSEQNLVDCVKKDYGCNGGLMKDALEFVRDQQGIDDEDSYPYEARTRKCRFKPNKVAFSDSGAAILPSGNEEKLKEAVAKFGPVAVAIDASSLWFQFYHKGVYYNKHCKNKENQLDHGVLVVGYGTDPKKGDYWIVKNSWGASWGDKGYIKMARNRRNNCGIATVATIPTF